MYYTFENGKTHWFKSKGHALEYARHNNTRLVREFNG